VRRFLMAVLLGTLAVAIGCGGGSGSTSSTTQTIATPTQNVQPLIVDGGSTAFQQASGSARLAAPRTATQSIMFFWIQGLTVYACCPSHPGES
jgi:hypothetical protein